VSGEQSTASGNYSTWLDKPVLLHIAIGGFLTALMCIIVSESDATLRIRVADLWDFDILLRALN